MAVTFHKMHGLGNDFVLLDLRNQDFQLNAKVASQLAKRHTGIGCDQVLVLRKPATHRQLAAFEVWNSDGSRAEQCGNGVRCIALYLQMRSETPARQFLLGGPAGEVEAICLDTGQVQVDMGKPRFKAEHVPVSLEPVGDWYTLAIDATRYQLGAVSMGNPHALMVVDSVASTNVDQLGAAISRHSAFPKGCNAGFAEITDRNNIHLRVFERGAAETRACGSGACAAMSILRRAGLVEKTINVTQAGGVLIIEWTGEDDPVTMTGSATHIFEGILI
ncbi:MAG: diaminopimelate epimerase [Gammaproteobacteria bacterium]|nr:MAG: diaminopimelate epimerase [Gammaproteobacteria bacterium]